VDGAVEGSHLLEAGEIRRRLRVVLTEDGLVLRELTVGKVLGEAALLIRDFKSLASTHISHVGDKNLSWDGGVSAISLCRFSVAWGRHARLDSAGFVVWFLVFALSQTPRSALACTQLVQVAPNEHWHDGDTCRGPMLLLASPRLGPPPYH